MKDKKKLIPIVGAIVMGLLLVGTGLYISSRLNPSVTAPVVETPSVVLPPPDDTTTQDAQPDADDTDDGLAPSDAAAGGCPYPHFLLRVQRTGDIYKKNIGLKENLEIFINETIKVVLLNDTSATEQNQIRNVDIKVGGGGVSGTYTSGQTFKPTSLGSITVTATDPACGSATAKISVVQTRCGFPCRNDADCATSAAGVETFCKSDGVCAPVNCPDDYEVGTANCDCNSLNGCGEPCSAAVGLCQAGTVCTFINGPGCAPNPDENNPTVTFCLPRSLPEGYSFGRCSSQSYLIVEGGGSITSSVLQDACTSDAPPSSYPVEIPRTNLNSDQLAVLGGIVIMLLGGIVFVRYTKKFAN